MPAAHSRMAPFSPARTVLTSWGECPPREGEGPCAAAGDGGRPVPHALQDGDAGTMGQPGRRHRRLHERKCTDKGCAVFLLFFLVGLWHIYSQARKEGNLAKLTHGFDWKGEICGVDEAVRDRPLLYWCDPEGE